MHVRCLNELITAYDTQCGGASNQGWMGQHSNNIIAGRDGGMEGMNNIIAVRDEQHENTSYCHGNNLLYEPGSL
eukprot:1139091-Pelagomonas_calceolata.AAC.1